MYPQSVLSKNKKTISVFHLKIIISTAVKNHSIVHGRVFVMLQNCLIFSCQKLAFLA